MATAPLEGKDGTFSLEHEDNFVVSDYVILEHYGEGRENLDGSSPDMGYAEEPTNINKVPDAINILATLTPSVRNIENQRPEIYVKETFGTVDNNVRGDIAITGNLDGHHCLSDGVDTVEVNDDDDQCDSGCMQYKYKNRQYKLM